MIAPAVAQAWTPLCMEPDELAGWQEMRDRNTSKHDRAALPCRDCLPGFAAEMHETKSPEYPEGRCNGTPRGDEKEMDMDQPEPRRAGDLLQDASRALTIRRVALDVAAPPCASCVHEPICALRHALEDMTPVETAAPPLPAGLRLALVATVTCDHFLRDRAKPAPVRVLTSEQRGQANRPKRQFSEEGRERVAAANRLRAERQRAAKEGAATA